MLLPPTGPGSHITMVHLTPVKHQAKHHSDEQTVLGMEGLKKIGLHLNGEEEWFEIEEEKILILNPE